MRESLRRWVWFVGLWIAGVATVAVLAYGLRLIIL